MLKVGLTGGIGSGKSMVSKIIEAMGYSVFNSDEQAKELSDSHPKIREALIKLFGDEVYIESSLNRPFLASKIFNDKSLLQKVNEIIHPRVRLAFQNFSKKNNKELVFNEAAILIETGAHENFDKMILVTAPEEVRINRVMNRDKCSRDEVLQRLSKQWTDDKKKDFADIIINNDGVTPLVKQVEEAIDYLTSSQGSKSSS